MPKIKTRNAVAKRFKITKNGKVKHTQEGRRHKLVKANKTTKRKESPAQERLHRSEHGQQHQENDALRIRRKVCWR